MTVRLFLCGVLPADDRHLPGLFARLSNAERDRAARFVRGRDRRAYAAAHALLRRALDLAAGRRAWRLTANALGKPVLDPPCDDIRFSLSHTDGLVAVALARGRDVGVDVEAAARDPDETVFSSLVLAPEEIAELDRFADRPERLLRLWVAKEAFAKAIGVGLSMPLKRVVLSGEEPRLASLPEAYGAAPEWWLQTERYGAHWLALAVSPSPCRVERVEMTVENLLTR
jgi:4'-phosphopantetheinyl transferase